MSQTSCTNDILSITKTGGVIIGGVTMNLIALGAMTYLHVGQQPGKQRRPMQARLH